MNKANPSTVVALNDEIESLRQQLALKEHHYDVMKASAEVLAEQCEKYRDQLADSQKQVTMLRDALELLWVGTNRDEWDDVAINTIESALAATKPKP
ncbi:MAG: hypothetical protein IPJ55_16990 [Chloracidobacterium sp.]|nr:hypothetical protein [Chloracidobacterium sp.]